MVGTFTYQGNRRRYTRWLRQATIATKLLDGFDNYGRTAAEIELHYHRENSHWLSHSLPGSRTGDLERRNTRFDHSTAVDPQLFYSILYYCSSLN